MKHALLTMIGLALTLPAWSQQIPPVVISDANAAPQIEIPEGAFEITVPNLGTLPVDASGRDALERLPSSAEALELDDVESADAGTDVEALDDVESADGVTDVEALDDVELVITRDGIRDAAHEAAEGDAIATAIATRPHGGRIIVIARSGNSASVAIAPEARVTTHAACSTAASRLAIVSAGSRVSIERAPNVEQVSSVSIIAHAPHMALVERVPDVAIVARAPHMALVERVPDVAIVERAPVARRVVVRVVTDSHARADVGAVDNASANDNAPAGIASNGDELADAPPTKVPAPQVSEYSRPEPPLPSAAELLEASNAGYSLSSAAPNPISTTASISFTLPRAGRALLAVYDNAGRVVATLADESLDAGTHTRTFDATGLPAGLYLYRLSSGSFAETKTMTVVR